MIKIIAFLLHHANRSCKDREFYAIKDKLLSMYGSAVGFDVQHIEGKLCHSCGGTGIFRSYHGFDDECYHCLGGWYKLPQWILLQNFQWYKYRFHKPIERKFVRKNPFNIPLLKLGDGDTLITGYIEHYPSKYSYLAVYALYLFYDRTSFKNKLKKWRDGLGFGWYVYWWYPRNWLNNIVYICLKGLPPRRIKCKPITPAAYDNGGRHFEELPF